MGISVRVIEHVAVRVEDRRLAERVVGVFLTHVAKLVKDKGYVPMLVLLVDRYCSSHVVARHDLVRPGPVNVPGYPVARPVPFHERLPVIVGEEPGHASDCPPDAAPETIIRARHAPTDQMALGVIVEKEAAVEVCQV